MRTRLLARIERLEFAGRPIPRFLLQYGWLRKLPEEYKGDRHINDFVQFPHRSRLSIREGLEWIEAEEVPGINRFEQATNVSQAI
jgi:hypothetical protein